VARLSATREELYATAEKTIREARETVAMMMREGAIKPVP
jgi:cobalamin biosynthesis protein CobT